MKIVEVNCNHELWQQFLAGPVKSEAENFFLFPQNTDSLNFLFSKSHSFYSRGDAACFIAIDNGVALGRIAAFIDNSLHANKETNKTQKIGSFGCFECIDSTGVAGELLSAASQWLCHKGVREMVGPVDFSIFHSYRVMSSGFELSPYPGEPRTPPYYRSLLEKCGLSVRSTWRTYEMSREDHKVQFEMLEPELKAFQDIHKDYQTVPFDPNHLKKELIDLYPLIMETFAENFGATDLSLEEYVSLYEPILPLLCLRSSFKLMFEGELAGFSFCYLNPFVPNTVVWHSIGNTKKHRGKGLLYLMAWKGFKSFFELNYDMSYGSLIKDGPNLYQRTKHATRTYQVFGKRLRQE